MNAPDIYAIQRPHRKLLTLYFLRSLVLGPLFPIAFVPLLFKYETLKFRFDKEGVMVSWGLLWKRETYVTYARVQDIHLSRGLLERWMGLATLEIQTASGSALPEVSIEGLLEFEAVRDHLYQKMRGARFGEREAAPAAAGSPVPAGEAELVLAQIRDELAAVRRALEERKS